MDAMGLDFPRATRDYADLAYPLSSRVVGAAQDAMDRAAEEALHGPADGICADCLGTVPMAWGDEGVEPLRDTVDADSAPLHRACEAARCPTCFVPANEPCAHRRAEAA